MKNLIFSCIFFNQRYVELLNLLFKSLNLYGNSNNIDYLVICDTDFKDIVEQLFTKYNINGYTWCINLQTIFDACCSRLKIFDYPYIQNYNKILYLDCDILVTNKIENVFNVLIENKIYTLKEGNTNKHYWGKHLFGENNPNIDAFTSGILLFKNDNVIKNLFFDIIEHINIELKKYNYEPLFFQTNNDVDLGIIFGDQPFIIYNSIKKNLYNNNSFKNIIINNPNSYDPNRPIDFPEKYIDQSICHFCGGVGDFDYKFSKMNLFMNNLITNKMSKFLIYFVLFKDYSYIKLFKILLTSICLFGNLANINVDFLIITDIEIKSFIENDDFFKNYKFQYLLKKCTELITIHSIKYTIFDYENINNYKHLLYLDIDTIVSSDLNQLNLLLNSTEKSLIAIKEGLITHEYYGSKLFKNDIDKYNDKTGISSGILLFKNNSTIKNLFNQIFNQIGNYNKVIPKTYDQSFLIYHSLKTDSIYKEIDIFINHPNSYNQNIIISHFPSWDNKLEEKKVYILNFFDRIIKEKYLEIHQKFIPNFTNNYKNSYYVLKFSKYNKFFIKIINNNQLEHTMGVSEYKLVLENIIYTEINNTKFIINFNNQNITCYNLNDDNHIVGTKINNNNIYNILWFSLGKVFTERDWINNIILNNLDNYIEHEHPRMNLKIENSIIIMSGAFISNKGFKMIFDSIENFGLIHLGDEYYSDPIWYYDKAKFVIRNYIRNTQLSDNLLTIPLGYGNYYCNNEKIVEIKKFKYYWTFIGSIKNKPTREKMIEYMKKTFDYDYYVFISSNDQSLSPEECVEIYKHSLFVLCPKGHYNSETFRILECLEYKCIPIIEGEKYYYQELFGKDHPFIVVQDFENIKNILNNLNFEELNDKCYDYYVKFLPLLKKRIKDFIYNNQDNKNLKIYSNKSNEIINNKVYDLFNTFDYACVYLEIKNNSLINVCTKQDYQNKINKILTLLEKAMKKYTFPDTKLVLITEDHWSYYNWKIDINTPHYSFCKIKDDELDNNVHLFPAYSFINQIELNIGDFEDVKNKILTEYNINWEDKKNEVFFNGSNSNYIRAKMNYSKYAIYMTNMSDKHNYFDIYEHCKYKYILDMDGRAWSIKFSYLLLMGCCVIKLVPEDLVYIEWFREFFNVNEDYIEIKYKRNESVKSIENKIDNAINTLDCKNMAINCQKKAVEIFSNDNISKYIFDSISDYTNRYNI